MTKEEAQEILRNLESGTIDVSLSNGLVRSSKELFSVNENTFRIFHGIDGTMVDFTFDQAVEVLTGARSPWDGIVLEDEDEE